jgi:hypothetical protein
MIFQVSRPPIYPEERPCLAEGGKAATKFWILDFGFWIKEKEAISKS